eukprot:12647658-Alexandrium_andersonii.AAC.1
MNVLITEVLPAIQAHVRPHEGRSGAQTALLKINGSTSMLPEELGRVGSRSESTPVLPAPRSKPAIIREAPGNSPEAAS